jgi:hypothetical protein
MAEGYVGRDTVRQLYQERNGAPLTGQTVTYTLVAPNGSTVVAAAAATENGLGYYSYTIDGPTYLNGPGLYRETWGSTGAVDQPVYTYLNVLYPQGPLVRRWHLRHSIARMLGDLRIGVSTGSNTSTTLKDTGLVEGDNDWRGAWLYIYAGLGRTEERQLTSSTQTGGVLTHGTAWTTTPDTTSRYELHRRWSVADYNGAINDALGEISNDYLLPITDESLTISSTTTYEYQIPAPFYSVHDVWWEDTSQTYPVWSPLSTQRGEWRVLGGGRGLLRIPHPPSTTTRLRLVGQAQPTALITDDDFVTVPVDFLRYTAAALLLAGKIRSPQNDPDGAQGLYDRYQQAAEGLLTRLRRPPKTNSARV